MRKRPVFLLMLLATVIVTCPSVFGLAGEIDVSKPIVQQPDWPGGVADLLNSQKPVYAFFVNSQDNYYYSGDAAAFNDFMARYAELSGIPHTLVLHCGRGEVKDRIANSADSQPSYAFDWYIFVVPPMIPDGGLDKTSPYKRYVTVNLYLGCNIQLSDIKVPAKVKVIAGKEIGDFIKKHEARSVDVTTDSGKFGIYLLADEKMNADAALKLKLDDIPLQKKPLLAMDDFVCYSWDDHSFELTRAAAARLPKPGVFGVPYVVVLNGQRSYLGAFWTSISSAGFRNPVIMPKPWLAVGGTTFEIRRAYPGVTADAPKNDPRDSPAIRFAFQMAGKLDACGDAALQSKDGVSGTPSAASGFGIYLLKDEKIGAVDALRWELEDVPLQDMPLFTMGDITRYTWSRHWSKYGMEMTDHALSRLPAVYKDGPPVQRLPKGVPFVFVAGGKRIYLGAFCSVKPPAAFKNPVIYLVHAPVRSFNILWIDPGKTPPKDDPYHSPLIKAAFEKAGKLDMGEETPCP